ncbi:hypothetical protein ABZ801_22205 [Actinomadura sp. NPDC047616]|uniref:hypothetical protein n=1 Tax=Actinomadura sp. NPDC047616 TaxID=3155914 RepID=UPI0033CF9237
MERRRLLKLLGLSLGAGPLVSSGEPLRQLLDLALQSEDRSVEDWEVACVNHMHALQRQPPVQVRDGLLVDLLALQRQLKNTAAKNIPDLSRVAAVQSFMMANALTRLGDHSTAIHWWHTAKAAADASGDLHVRLMVRSEEAGCGLYGQHGIPTVLRLLDDAQELGPDKSSFWYADLAGTRAKALTLLGRHDEAQRELATFVDYDGDDWRARIIPIRWNFGQQHFAESWVYAGAGDEAKADEARGRLLAHNPNYTHDVNGRLHEAVCTVVNGGIDQGAQQATALLGSLPSTHRSAMISEVGRMVLRMVPLDQRDRPAVQDLRATLAATAPHATLSQL